MASPRRAAAAAMAGNAESGFDVVVICCSGVIEAGYWSGRLEATRGSIIATKAKVYSVDEDWKGGAGNGLGTLYAYKKACAAATDFDIDGKLKAGEISVAIYHTAGKGTRLAPLPGSENNNKPGVKLPATVQLSAGPCVPVTILEAVLKQTAAYASSRRGRLSVFWGDQVFIPGEPTTYTPSAHIDLLSQMCKVMPSAEEWARKGLQSYGLAVELESGDGAQIEKVDHATANRMLGVLGSIKSVGPSLGSFSVSHHMLELLVREYAPELERREGQLDTDPHFWMPMTLPKPAYVELMGKKKVSEAEAEAQWTRMRGMLAKVDTGALKLFGAVDVGENAYWWDYGQLTFYANNNLRLTQDGPENDAYRSFFGQPRGEPQHSDLGEVAVDGESSVANCEIKSGAVAGAALCGVTATRVEAKGCILVNVTAKSIRAAPNSICYNVVDSSDEGIVLGEGEVLTTVFGEDGTQTRMRCSLSTDGKEQWSVRMPGNSMSFAEVHAANKGVDPVKCEKAQSRAHDEVAEVIGCKRKRRPSA
eukprot:TRINITY_DN2059_c1_g1_i1.p1 TRINITY_DN2059_c1_g1~~TRINITY_DN2059_c1_g1_i1.p1  ORF type:complete len:572 (+),score=158.24 TRINITY_DN2059_c1_g1_i1:115-1716(+)